MSTVFADSSFHIAAVNPHDALHEAAMSFLDFW